MTSVNPVAPLVNSAVMLPVAAVAATPAQDDGFSFDDLLDIVNPLQHIPVVSTIYRAITGDTIKTGPKLAGDTLYGGIEGFASSLADTVFTKITGKSVGDTVLGWVEDAFSPSAPTGIAANAPADPAEASAAAPVAAADFVDRIFDWIGREFSPSHAADATAATPAAAALPAPATPVATAAPVALQTSATEAIVVPGQDELLLSLNRSGVGQDVALRAADAYRRTLNVAGAAADTALH